MVNSILMADTSQSVRQMDLLIMILHVRIKPSSHSAVMSADNTSLTLKRRVSLVLPLTGEHVLPRRRDESASATYYFRREGSEEASGGDALVKEWMYYRPLQRGESEFPLRNKQVVYSSPLSCCCNFANFLKVGLIKTSSSSSSSSICFLIIVIPPLHTLF